MLRPKLSCTGHLKSRGFCTPPRYCAGFVLRLLTVVVHCLGARDEMVSSCSRLILIGTVHRDCTGEERLRAILERFAPACVTLELSPTSLLYRQRHGALLRRRLERILRRLAGADPDAMSRIASHPVVGDIRRLLELPFEYRAAAAYGAAQGVVPELIDLPQVAEQKLRRIQEELITLRNLRTLLALPAPPRLPESYADAVVLVERATSPTLRRAFLLGRRGDEGIGPRDRQMAEALRRCCQKFVDGTVVHIGGWVHLVDDPDGQTLYSRLADLQPQRLLLGSAAPFSE